MAEKRNDSPVSQVFVCSYANCSKIFSRRDRLTIHLRTHSGEKPFVCDEDGCDKSYARAAHLKRHYQSSHVHNKTLTKYRCSEEGCEKEYGSQSNLKRHLKEHGERHYECEFEGCTKKFRKHFQLSVHEREHTNSGPFTYICPAENCQKSFSTASRLQRHRRVHDGYSCTEVGCEAKFEKWTQLWKHRSVAHTQDYTCAECGKVFSKQFRLSSHMKTHSDIREVFECPRADCSRVYLEQKALKAHIRSYHDGVRFPCTDCQRTFASKQKLQQHGRLHDPNKPPPKKRPKKGHRRKSMALKLAQLALGEKDGSSSNDDVQLEDSGIQDPEDADFNPPYSETLKQTETTCTVTTTTNPELIQTSSTHGSEIFSSISNFQNSKTNHTESLLELNQTITCDEEIVLNKNPDFKTCLSIQPPEMASSKTMHSGIQDSCLNDSETVKDNPSLKLSDFQCIKEQAASQSASAKEIWDEKQTFIVLNDSETVEDNHSLKLPDFTCIKEQAASQSASAKQILDEKQTFNVLSLDSSSGENGKTSNSQDHVSDNPHSNSRHQEEINTEMTSQCSTFGNDIKENITQQTPIQSTKTSENIFDVGEKKSKGGDLNIFPTEKTSFLIPSIFDVNSDNNFTVISKPSLLVPGSSTEVVLQGEVKNQPVTVRIQSTGIRLDNLPS